MFHVYLESSGFLFIPSVYMFFQMTASGARIWSSWLIKANKKGSYTYELYHITVL